MGAAVVQLLPENTAAKVVSSGKFKMYGVPHTVVQIDLTDKELAGVRGWVERDNVIDTPLLDAYNSMRATGKKPSNSDAGNP